MTASAPANQYWEKRKDSIYLHAAQLVCRKFAESPASVLDVGSNGTPTLEWHRDSATRLVSIDIRRPYKAPGVVSLKEDFLRHEFSERFALVTCFQVLEHVLEPEAFARKLLRTGDIVVVSVPYMWKEDACKYHIHDPVDEAKLLSWLNKIPRYSYRAAELNGVARLIQVYHA